LGDDETAVVDRTGGTAAPGGAAVFVAGRSTFGLVGKEVIGAPRAAAARFGAGPVAGRAPCQDCLFAGRWGPRSPDPPAWPGRRKTSVETDATGPAIRAFQGNEGRDGRRRCQIHHAGRRPATLGPTAAPGATDVPTVA